MLATDRRFTKDELLRESGASNALLQDAVSASLIVPAEVYGEDSLGVLKALVELQRSGIEPRHLRGFRAAAERELGLIESALIPIVRRNDVSGRAQAAELAREIAGQLEVVRESLIRSALGRPRPVTPRHAASVSPNVIDSDPGMGTVDEAPSTGAIQFRGERQANE